LYGDAQLHHKAYNIAFTSATSSSSSIDCFHFEIKNKLLRQVWQDFCVIDSHYLISLCSLWCGGRSQTTLKKSVIALTSYDCVTICHGAPGLPTAANINRQKTLRHRCDATRAPDRRHTAHTRPRPSRQDLAACAFGKHVLEGVDT
tara:strand:+ start:36270 stop:36707 length:438 start_codon:yes stop_codon:yes gene_type:complete